MVLNSVTWDTELLISVDGLLDQDHREVHDGTCSMEGTPDLEVCIPTIRTAWIKDRDVRIGSIDDEGKAHWTKVEVHTAPCGQRGRHHAVQGDTAGAERTSPSRVAKACSSASATRSHATVETSEVGDYLPMAATLTPDVAEISTLNLIDWIKHRMQLRRR
jgi:hypothetical protein